MLVHKLTEPAKQGDAATVRGEGPKLVRQPRNRTRLGKLPDVAALSSGRCCRSARRLGRQNDY